MERAVADMQVAITTLTALIGRLDTWASAVAQLTALHPSEPPLEHDGPPDTCTCPACAADRMVAHRRAELEQELSEALSEEERV